MHTPIDKLKVSWAFDGSSGNITQYFGNKALLYTNLGLDGHNGIDLVDKWRTPLRAVCTGVIVQVNREATGYGRNIRLLDKDKDGHGYQENWVYGHCEDIFVEAGDFVEAGQIIGTMGNTGFVTAVNPDGSHSGTHLHLGVRKERWKDGIRMSVKNLSNGYYGRYDFKERLVHSTQEVTPNMQRLSIIAILKQVIALLKLQLAMRKK